MAYMCPVCGYPALNREPRTEENGGSYEICVSCGFQFGVSDDDLDHTYASWRREWIAGGTRWQSVALPEPANWDPNAQLGNLRMMPPTTARTR